MENTLPLKAFLRVAELKSFTKAAASLGLPKASVSAHVQNLENELGTRLLHRTTRSVALTQDGTLFIGRAKDLLSDLEELGSLFRKDTKDLTGRIRIDMASRLARLTIIPRLPEFFARHPGIHLELGCTDREVDVVREGYDCVIRGGELKDSGLVARKIAEMPILALASPAYLKRYGTPKKPADLRDHYLVQWLPNFGGTEAFEYFEGKEMRSVAMKSLITVNSAEAYTAACSAGLGIIQVPRALNDDYLAREKLVQVLPQLELGSMPISLVYPHRRHLPKRVGVFMDWVAKVIEEPRKN